MNLTVIALVGAGIVIVGLVIGLYGRSERKLGGTRAVSEGQERTLDDVQDAKRAKELLDTNPRARKQLHKRFTRK